MRKLYLSAGYVFVFFFLVLMSSSCTSVPKPTGYGFSSLKKMQSVAHWQILAKDVATQINKQLLLMQNCGEISIFLKKKDGSFNEVFHKLLTSSLVNISRTSKSGFTVTTSKDDAYVLEVDAQVIRHRADRIQQIPPGTITIAGTLIKVIYDIGSSASDLIIPVSALVDVGVSSYSELTHNEVVITSTIRDGDTYLFTRSDLYYINDYDTDHYDTGVLTQVATRSFAAEGLE